MKASAAPAVESESIDAPSLRKHAAQQKMRKQRIRALARARMRRRR